MLLKTLGPAPWAIALWGRALLGSALVGSAVLALPAQAADNPVIEVKCNGQCNLLEQQPLVVLPFEGDAALGDLSGVAAADLARSGMFAVSRNAMPSAPSVSGKVTALPNGQIKVDFELKPATAGAPVLIKTVTTSSAQWRSAAHTVADWVLHHLTGSGAMFNSRIVFVERSGQGANRRYKLMVTDADGARPVAVLTSPRPILSPTWSPDGQFIAYTSFENTSAKPLHKARIWIMQPSTGQRRIVADFAGDNAFASWSPDGQQLAVALSFSGATKLYTLRADGTGEPRRLTNSVGSVIETEPFWSAQGDIYFASDVSGAFQIYRYSSAGNRPTTQLILTTKGDVSTPSVSPDGKQLAFVSRSLGAIGVKDLSQGDVTLVPNSGGLERPVWAPNGLVLLASGAVQATGNSKPLAWINPNVKSAQAHPLRSPNGPATLGDGPHWGHAFTQLSKPNH